MLRIGLTYLMLIIHALLGSSLLRAQVSMSEFLRSAGSDAAFTSYDEQVKYLDGRPYRLSPLRRVEFRTGSNQLDPSRQDYAFRFSPANPWENKNNNSYYEQYRSVLSLKSNLALKDALAHRYNLIIRLLYFEAIKKVKEANTELTAAQIAVLEKQRQSDFFNGEDFVEMKMNQMDEMVALEEVTFDFEDQRRRMAVLYPPMAAGEINWRYENILSVDRIENIVDSLFGVNVTQATLLYRDHQIELANREYLLEKSNVNIGFLQTQYQHYRIEQDRKPWNISLGIAIPITNPNKGDMTRRKLEVIDAQHRRDETELSLQSGKIASRDQIKNLIMRYRNIQKKINALNIGSLSNILGNMKDDNPVVRLRFSENILRLKTIEIKIRQDILVSYIEFLVLTDTIQQQPLINYLTENLEYIGL